MPARSWKPCRVSILPTAVVSLSFVTRWESDLVCERNRRNLSTASHAAQCQCLDIGTDSPQLKPYMLYRALSCETAWIPQAVTAHLKKERDCERKSRHVKKTKPDTVRTSARNMRFKIFLLRSGKSISPFIPGFVMGKNGVFLNCIINTEGDFHHNSENIVFPTNSSL